MSAMTEIAAELKRQQAVWGEQNHPDGTGADQTRSWLGRFRAFANAAWAANLECETRAANGELTWLDVLAEEFFEVAEADPDSEHMREELIQVAAVCANAIEAYDRRQMRKALNASMNRTSPAAIQ